MIKKIKVGQDVKVGDRYGNICQIFEENRVEVFMYDTNKREVIDHGTYEKPVSREINLFIQKNEEGRNVYMDQDPSNPETYRKTQY